MNSIIIEQNRISRTRALKLDDDNIEIVKEIFDMENQKWVDISSEFINKKELEACLKLFKNLE